MIKVLKKLFIVFLWRLCDRFWALIPCVAATVYPDAEDTDVMSSFMNNKTFLYPLQSVSDAHTILVDTRKWMMWD